MVMSIGSLDEVSRAIQEAMANNETYASAQHFILKVRQKQILLAGGIKL